MAFRRGWAVVVPGEGLDAQPALGTPLAQVATFWSAYNCPPDKRIREISGGDSA